MAKTWNSSEPSQEWLADKNYPKSAAIINPRGPGRLAVVNGTINSAIYPKILKENIRPSVHDLKHTLFLQNNDPKHTSKSTSEWLKKTKIKTLEWPSQSLDLNLIVML
ncbi:hypothetical protein P4O66_017908 [Electrophorus voltai]|uniref:Tc1-like transposase DDE domain-containing protein n=1 Tax=Electrophorus voltai TaxID=2609070 RepID=A0AAD8YTP7_9TELE|nr:hypothetical protein P4O66_017908 [Electrophorus voltai]